MLASAKHLRTSIHMHCLSLTGLICSTFHVSWKIYKIDKRGGSFYNYYYYYYYYYFLCGCGIHSYLNYCYHKYDILWLYVTLLVIRYDVGIQCCWHLFMLIKQIENQIFNLVWLKTMYMFFSSLMPYLWENRGA